MCALRSVAVSSILALAIATPVASRAQVPPLDIVSTLAGSGQPGSADGTAKTATFLMPAAVAADAAGHVFVADAAGERIREIVSATQVRTVAGGGGAIARGLYVAGNLRDARFDEARFSTPSGIVVASDRTVYVADTNNGAIRRISRDGNVTTFVRDLGLPRQLALDHAGNLYVADSKRGVLRISPDGTVTVLNLDADRPYGVAISDGAAGPTKIFVADARGVSMSQIDGSNRIGYLNVEHATPGVGNSTEGSESIGTPYQLVSLGGSGIAYTDMRAHCVRYLDFVNNIAFVVAGRGDESANMDAGDFADGPDATARFDGPMGIAVLPNGSLAVADAGNRRVRLISGFDPREVVRDPLSVLSEHRDPRQYRILFLGASNIWWATGWARSIPGIVEKSVASDVHARSGKTARVVPVQMMGAQLEAFSSYVANVVDAHAADAVVLEINDGSVAGDAPGWKAGATTVLRSLRATLARAHVPLVVVAEPLAFELDPIERAYRKTTENSYLPANVDAETDWSAIAKDSGVPLVDLWGPMLKDLRSPRHRALFGSDDEHFSEYGRLVAGDAVAAALLRLRPWVSAR